MQDWTNATWRKSSASGSGDNCVEVAEQGGMIGVRDSKLGDASHVLEFNRDEWAAFRAGVIAGEL